MSNKTNENNVFARPSFPPTVNLLPSPITTSKEEVFSFEGNRKSWQFFANFHRKRQHLRPEESGKVDARPNPHRKKLMLSVFWDMKGVINCELLGKKETLNKDEYCRQLQVSAEELKEKRPKKTKILLHHDNAKPHIASAPTTTIWQLGCGILPHPAWSPDCAPTDYTLFRPLKNEITDQRFENRNHLENWLKKFFASKSRNHLFWCNSWYAP